MPEEISQVASLIYFRTMSSVIRVRVGSCRTLWKDDTPAIAKTVQLCTEISEKSGRQNTNRIQANFVAKDVKSALFLSKLVISHSVVCTAVVDIGCIRINQQSPDLKALIWSTKMFDPVKGETVWVTVSLTSRTCLSADLSVVITYRGLSHFSSKGELHDFVFQRLIDNVYLA